MKNTKEYLMSIKDEQQHLRLDELFKWLETEFPNLNFRFAWNQPMFTDHDTFIIGFSLAKHHLAVSPEAKGIDVFGEEIEKAGYTHGSNLFRIKWHQEINYKLLKDIITYNIQDKFECNSFWRK